jgi:glutathione synthase
MSLLPQTLSQSQSQTQTAQKHSLLWITDPWSTLAHDQDTTLRFLHEAVHMGLPTYWSASDFILQPLSPKMIQVVSAMDVVAGRPTQFVELPASSFHQVHYRVDPPVDFNYLDLLEKLTTRINPALIFSPPALLQNQSEKIPPKSLAAFTPRTAVIRTTQDIHAAWSLFHKDSRVVLKPLHQAQSKGVTLLTAPPTLPTWSDAIRRATNEFQNPMVIQEYLPGIDQGEVRMWFARGEFIAALKKYPKSGDFRVLIDEGSRVEAYTLNAQEQQAALAVGDALRAQGVLLAAVDWIDGKISDYNFTSPGLLVQLEKVHQQNFARPILTKLLQHAEITNN